MWLEKISCWQRLDSGCAQFILINMCAKVPEDHFGPAFVLSVHNKIVPVSYQQYPFLFYRCMQLVGQDTVQFSSHSFRRGGDTWALRSEVPGELVKVYGDWTSDAYRSYSKFSLEQFLLVAKSMVNSVCDVININ